MKMLDKKTRPLHGCLLAVLWITSCGLSSTLSSEKPLEKTAATSTFFPTTLEQTSGKPAPQNTKPATKKPSPTLPPATATPESPFVPYVAPLLPEFAVARLGKGAISGAAVSPSGEDLAVATYIGVYLYRMEEDGVLREIWFIPTTIRMTAVAFSPDGKTLACGSYNDRNWAFGEGPHRTAVLLLDAASGTPLDVFFIGVPGTEVTGLAFSPDGTRLAATYKVVAGEAGLVDLGVAFLDLQSGDTSVASYMSSSVMDELQPQQVTDLSFSPDGAFLVVGLEFFDYSMNKQGGVLLLNAETHDTIQVLAGHADGVRSTLFSPDGRLLASVDKQGVVILRDAVSWEKIRSLTTGSTEKEGVNYYCLGGNSSRLAFSADGKTLAAGMSDGRIHEWNAATGSKIRILNTQKSGILALSYSGDGLELASASFDRSAVRYRISSGAVLQTYSLDEHFQLSSVAFSPGNKTLVATDACAGVGLWDISIRKILRSFYAGPAAYSPDGKTLATAGAAKSIILWDTTTWSQKTVLRGHTDFVNSIAFSPDGETLASGGDDQSLILWDAATGGQRWKVAGLNGYVANIAFSPDGKTLAHIADLSPSHVSFRDPETGYLQGSLEDDFWGVSDMEYSPDGKYFAVVSFSSMISLYTYPGYEYLGSPDGGTDVAFSPGGTIAASGSIGNEYYSVFLWDPSGFKNSTELTGHNSLVISVAFAPDGKRIASASRDGTIMLWDLDAALER